MKVRNCKQEAGKAWIQEELAEWFDANKTLLETAYLNGRHPWQQSGVGLHSQRTAADWETLRRPIADCIRPLRLIPQYRLCQRLPVGVPAALGRSSGALLLIPMASIFPKNWSSWRKIAFPISPITSMSAMPGTGRPRRPSTTCAPNWSTFQQNSTEQFVSLLLARYLHPHGRLLIAEYRGRQQAEPAVTIDSYLTTIGFPVKM